MSARKRAAQLDAEIAHALAKRERKPSPEIVTLFEWLADIAEAEGAENLALGQRDLGYTGDRKEFRYSDIFATRMPSAKHDRLVEVIEEASLHPHSKIGRVLTAKEASWMRAQARRIYDEERRHIETALQERNP
ncbi:MAG TPA: hypothetical protein VLE97_11560 [Gaiellaceae bacterium]|nr:hypothetical protein [Gaiellaceae bacterium]